MSRRWILLGLLAGAPALGAAGNPGPHDVRFDPVLMESAGIPPFRHHVDVRADLGLDGFRTQVGTETLRGMFTRARPSLEYRYAPAKNAEFLFRAPYMAQSSNLFSSDGRRVHTRYSAGASAPVIGFKLLLGRNVAFAAHTSPPTAAPRDPPLGDGTHYDGMLLFHLGSCHVSASHTVRLPYAVHAATQTFRRESGDVTELALALTKRDDPAYPKRDYVAPTLEIHGIYSDRARLDGQGIPGSAALTGKFVFGFVLGKINSRATHLTRVAVSAGVGDLLHKTEDPTFGVGALELMLGYGLYWGGL
jgi:hypothetical protein